MKRMTIMITLILVNVLVLSSMPTVALRHTMDTSLSNIDASYKGEIIWDQAGKVVARAGDVNGDGHDDFLVGSSWNDESGGLAGQAYLLLGKSSGFSTGNSLANSDASFLGEDPGDHAGSWVASAGDVDGDGYDDILVGANGSDPNGESSGEVYLILGKSSGWNNDTDLSNSDASFHGESAGDNVGICAEGVGDVNGDGYDDILIGAHLNSGGGTVRGKAYLIMGKATGWSMDTALSTVGISFVGEDDGDWLGYSLDHAGDVNADGMDDFMISVYKNDDGGNNAGKVYLYLGRISGWTQNMNESYANASFIGEEAGDEAGKSMASGGDVNGDGYDDILITAQLHDYVVGNNGQVYVIFGSASNWSMDTDLSAAPASFVGEASGDSSGSDADIVGDVNGDLLDDILIGAWTNDEAGSAGGQSYLILGNSTGWSMHRSLSLSDASYHGELGLDRSGLSVRGAGDVNGDGLDDLLIGAHWNDGGAGNAGSAYLIFPELNSKPTAISTVLAYSDDTYSSTISIADMDAQIFVELTGTDGDTNHKDLANVKVTSSATSPGGFRLNLVETGKNTGKYRGNFTIKDRTHDGLRWIGASEGETITIKSIQNPTKYATVEVTPPLLIYPLADNLTVQEDEEYSTDYWTSGWPSVDWTFTSNATWLFWNSGTHKVSGTPDNSNVGTCWLCINVSNGAGGYDERKFTLKVNNTPPTIGTTNVIATPEDALYLVDYDSNDDGQGTITWSLDTDAGDWLTIDPASGNLSGVPSNDDLGDHSVNVSVNDGNGGRAYTEFGLAVYNTNDPPSITTTHVTETDEDAIYSVDYEAVDIDPTGDTIEWDLGADTNATFLDIDPDTGVISGVPENEHVGVHWVNVTVEDDYGDMNWSAFELTVVNTNDIPLWMDVPEDRELKIGRTYTFDVNATDIDIGDILVYDVVTTPTSTLTIDADTGLITWTANAVGTLTVNIGASDESESIYHEYNITVLSTNAAPTSTLVAPVDGATSDVLNPTFKWTVYDDDEDTVTCDVYISSSMADVTGLASTAKAASLVDGTQVTPATLLEKGTKYYWTVIPYDGTDYGTCTNGIWSLTTLETATENHLPQFLSEPGLEAGVGKEWTYEPIATDEDEGDTVSIILVSNPVGMTLAGGILSWTPTDAQLGDHDVVIEATDGKGSKQQPFTITVTTEGPSNHKPDLDKIDDMEITEGDPVSVPVVATDQDDDTLTYSLEKKPEGAEISDTGVITWTPGETDAGVHEFVVQVSDGKVSSTISFEVTVNDRVVDVNGETPEKEGEDDNTMLLVAIVLIIVVVVVVALLLLTRRKKPSEDADADKKDDTLQPDIVILKGPTAPGMGPTLEVPAAEKKADGTVTPIMRSVGGAEGQPVPLGPSATTDPARLLGAQVDGMGGDMGGTGGVVGGTGGGVGGPVPAPAPGPVPASGPQPVAAPQPAGAAPPVPPAPQPPGQ